MMQLAVFLSADDPTHAEADRVVKCGIARTARVETPEGHLLFVAWRVSDQSYAWRTSIMAAPAFAPLYQPRHI